jgi:hypothetical protein
MKNRIRELNFSENFLKVEYIENSENYKIGQKAIIVNLGDSDIEILGKKLKPMKSSVYSNVQLKQAKKVVLINLKPDFFSNKAFAFSKEITGKWKLAYDVFQLQQLKDVKLWISEKDRIGNVEFNLWFAPAGTNCRIHKEHDFKEIHTQVYGMGRMQKFNENDGKTLYQEVFMSPGYTHDPFCDENGIYPWHRYYADTDCIWMAIEFH